MTIVPGAFQLFQVFGVELEYMIVDAESLSVKPIADELLHAVAGAYGEDFERGPISWSNELALHVFELKTSNPAQSLRLLPKLFAENVREANRLLAPVGARLMPTAMHPWMDPMLEMRLWPHSYNAVYEAFHQIFDCRGHGWANLQSAHINLPFAGDEQFGALHAAIRLVLPILPAIAASSPVIEGRLSTVCDARLETYRTNAHRVPSVSGRVIPEPVFTREDYRLQILEPMYRDIAPLDTGGILQCEWLNSRGAIARFDRNAIEIRLIDMQESPQADLAIAAAVVTVLESLVHEKWSSTTDQQKLAIDPLEKILLATISDAEEAIIDDVHYLKLFGFEQPYRCSAGELWWHLLESTGLLGQPDFEAWQKPLQIILNRGSLARRIRRALANDLSPPHLKSVYQELCDCLAANRVFDP